jgi:DNA-binding NarL/FixJ family response regulator
MLRILVVEDHVAFRQALTFLLELEPDRTVVGQAGSLAEARPLLAGVDVAIVDLDLPDGSGVDLVQPLGVLNPHGAVLILTASGDRREYARAVLAGAAGVLHKSVPISAIVNAVGRLGQGEPLLATSEIIELLRMADHEREQGRDTQAALGRLTQRERAVLQLLGEGLHDEAIGARLQIETETARTHMTHILGKLGVHSRLQALVFAIRHGAVTID